MRGRNYSYSPSPSRLYRRRYRSPMSRGYCGSGTEPPTSLLVRNLRRDCRPEDLRRPFGQFGPIKDIYLPRDYYTGEPRGFGFVQYVDPADAADAKYEMDGYALHGRELTVVFAEENRKRPSEMRAKQRLRDRSYDRRYSRSPRYGRSYSRSPEYYSRSRRYCSRSISPHERHRRELSYDRERSYSRSPYRSPNGSRSRSQTPYRRRSFSLSRSVSPEYIKHRE